MGALKSKLPLIIIVAHKSCTLNRQIRVGDSKYDIFDLKFWPLDLISPQILLHKYFFFAWNTLLPSSHMRVCYKIFTPLGYWVLLAKKQRFRPKLAGSGLGEHPKKIWDPYLFLQRLKLATSNLVCNLGLGLASKKTRIWTKISGGLGQGSIQKNLGPPTYFCNRWS